jgi:hypothetical protein
MFHTITNRIGYNHTSQKHKSKIYILLSKFCLQLTLMHKQWILFYVTIQE